MRIKKGPKVKDFCGTKNLVQYDLLHGFLAEVLRFISVENISFKVKP